MPSFHIETNIPRGRIPADFIIKAVPLLGKTLGRPEKYCLISITPDMLMTLGGTNEPCAVAHVNAIGVFDEERNKKHAKIFFEFIEKELGIKNDRMFLIFEDRLTRNVGLKGTTFHDMFGPTLDNNLSYDNL